MIEQQPYDPNPPAFGTDDFAVNPEPRCACLLLLDISGSMRGQPIAELNRGLQAFKSSLQDDPLATKRVDVAIVTFGGSVRVEQDFTNAAVFSPPQLSSTGDTPLGEAVTKGLDVLRRRKDTYKANGILYYRPWVFLFTDGGPTDNWIEAARQVRDGEGAKGFLFYAVGVEGADFGMLKQLAVREPLRLDGLRFVEMFEWLSTSMKAVSGSQPGQAVSLTNPVAPNGWASTV